jgi:hypothetical protein
MFNPKLISTIAASPFIALRMSVGPQAGKDYSGLVMGTVENDGHYYAVQMLGDNHVILHGVEKGDLPKISSIIGKKVEVKCLDGRIGVIAEEVEPHERSRGWSR